MCRLGTHRCEVFAMITILPGPISVDSSFPAMWLNTFYFQPRSLLTSHSTLWSVPWWIEISRAHHSFLPSSWNKRSLILFWFTSPTRSSRLWTPARERFVISVVDKLRMSSAGQSSPHDHKDQGILFELVLGHEQQRLRKHRLGYLCAHTLKRGGSAVMVAALKNHKPTLYQPTGPSFL